MKNQWPDGGSSPFAFEKDTNWEGAYRVPALIRWTGKIKAGSNFNGSSAEDWLPTLVAAAGGSQTVREDSVKGVTLGSKTFKVHIDGYDQLPYLTGQTTKSARPRVRVLQRRRRSGRLPQRSLQGGVSGAGRNRHAGLASAPHALRAPLLIDLKSDPYEVPDPTARRIGRSLAIEHTFLILPIVDNVGRYLATYKAFPPRQKPASFSIDQVIEKLEAGSTDALIAAASMDGTLTRASASA